jgi:hypothetical protein
LADKLKDFLPPSLFYWNESTGEIGGPGALNEPMPNGSARRKGKGIAIAGDLMSSLPQEMRADNLMCYIGHEGTYTPSHREMCASLGHNIMVHTSGDMDENSQPEKPGSSIWFMTESRDRKLVSEYWLSVLGHDIETENHFAQIIAWQKAPFKTYVVEQRVGDFILVPPLAPHQVWNRGTRTIKVAWNRTTVETLELALNEALPNARLVCRDEQYKNKAIIYYTLMKYSGLLKQALQLSNRSAAEAVAIASSKKVRQIKKDFKRLFELYKTILLSEMFAPDAKEHCEFIPFDSNVTCAYCRGNIFNRFLTCKSCPDIFQTGIEEPYDVCMDCFVLGRSCKCRSKYKWVEQFKWKELTARYEDWRRQIIEIDGGMTGKTPLPLSEERKLRPEKTVAHICQEQLKLRPWVDIKASNPVEDDDDESEEEIRLNDDGTVKKIVKKKTKAFLDKNKSCHNCIHRHPKWMTAMCTMCERYWCYGSLFRAHDLMPQTIMADPNWECPHCRRVCSTGACRNDPRQHPYKPNGTLLGHDTKKVADIRSIECLVDFSVSNLNWIKDNLSTPHESSIIQRKQAEAALEKQNNPMLDDRYAHDEDGYIPVENLANDEPHIEYSPPGELIDPALGGGSDPSNPQAQLNLAMDADIESPVIEGHASGDATDGMAGLTYPETSRRSHDGFVDPNSVLYYPTDPMQGMFEPIFVDPNSQGTPRRKRAIPEDGEQIKLVGHKKRKLAGEDDRPQTKNKASKQYQQEQDKKLLDQARKDGRYLYVWAKLNNKRQVVVLSLPSEMLAPFRAKDSASQTRQNQAALEANVLVRSDIVPPPTKQQVPQTTPNSMSKIRLYKVLIEDDDDFYTGRRQEKKSKQPRQRFEEITVEDEEEDEDGLMVDVQTNQEQHRDRRKTSWLAKEKTVEQGGIPMELPLNWKDPPLAVRKDRRRSISNVQPHVAQKTPSIRPAQTAASMTVTNDSPSPRVQKTASPNNKAPTQVVLSKSIANPEKAAAASKARGRSPLEHSKTAGMGEANRMAKLKAARWANDEASDDWAESSEPSPARTAKTKSLPTPTVINKANGTLPKPGAPGTSLLARLGRAVKIVSASSKRNSTGSAAKPMGPKGGKGPPGRKSLPGA